MKYKTCIPEKLPLKSLDWERLTPFLSKAKRAVDHFNLSWKDKKRAESLIRKELISSCEKGQSRKNYEKALRMAISKIKTVSISFELLCKIHTLAKKDSKGAVGKFRTKQNWIGPEGEGIEEAYFFPPDLPHLYKGLINLKKYLSYKEKDALVQLAILFAQLLILHPFMDGNGRVARITIPLFLFKKKVISQPYFFMSSYFKKHRLKYFEKLFAITTDGAWEEWIIFFLKGIKSIDGKR